MAYSIINESLYSYKQLQVASKARLAPGLHFMMTNGMRSLTSDGTPKPHMIVLQKGLLAGTFLTYAVHYADTAKYNKFRISLLGPYAGETTYFEFCVANKKISVWRYSKGGPEGMVPDTEHVSRTFNPGVVVYQLDVTSEGIMVLEDGAVTVKNRIKGDYSLCVQHGCNEAAYCGPTIIEMHISYKADPSTVFDTSRDFVSPKEVPLSVGGFALIEGSVASSCTIKYYNVDVFSKQQRDDNLRVLIKIYETKMLVSEEGKPGANVKEMAAPSINYLTTLPALTITAQGVKMKNFFMETGLIGVTWPK